ncbi:MAG TPA: rRNA maturation RNase YbeY [Solirubrobacteraceae bacterium]|jgi:probable rRNA maturation factor
MLEIDVIGVDGVAPGGSEGDADGPSTTEVEELCALALSSAGIEDGHLAVEFVSEDRIRELNRDYRQIDDHTDVLSFGVDEAGPSSGPRELGDIVICPEHTADVREAVLHGALHLCGMDHETDEGEMLALQAELMRWVS